MRIKALSSFFHEGDFIATGDEVDVPMDVGTYLVDQKAAIKIDGGKGTDKQEVPKDEAVIETKAKEAINALTEPVKEPAQPTRKTKVKTQ